jgi:dolichyl-phosphate-mannose-protein mannosyltransferase
MKPSSAAAPRQGLDPGILLSRAILILAVIFVVAVRLRLLTVPFERDEGEYAYAGRLILQGIPPYKLAYNMKLPGIYAGYALVMAIFGESVQGVHLGLLLLNLSAIALIVLLARRLFGGYVGAFAGAGYALLSLSPTVLGPFAHATHFVLVPALAGLLLLLRAVDTGRPMEFLGSGALLGIGFLMKQHGLFLILFAVFHLAWSWAAAFDASPEERGNPQAAGGDVPVEVPRRSGWSRILREGAPFAIGVALPYAAMCLILAGAGVFKEFWFWTVEYARAYVSEVPFSYFLSDLPVVMLMTIGANWPIWFMAAAGLVFLFRNEGTAGRRVFAAGLLTFTFLSVVPGYWLRPHYFVLLLPAIAILSALGIEALRCRVATTRAAEMAASAGALLFLAAALVVIVPQAALLLATPPEEVSREIYGDGLFAGMVEVGAFLEAHTAPGERIAVLGSEPEILFYANRPSVTGYVYMYAMMEYQSYAGRMQHEAVREIEDARPRYMVIVNAQSSWLLRPHSDRFIIDWGGKYAADHYNVVGLVEFQADGVAVVTWGPEADRKPRSRDHVLVLERKHEMS